MMIRVIHLFTTLDNGGVESFLYNYYSHMNRENIQFDFIVTGSNRGYLEPIMSKMNSIIFHVTRIRENPIMHIVQIYHILKNGHYDIIHCHGYKSFIGLIMGKLLGCNVRIIHSHMAFIDEKLCEYLYRKIVTFISKLFATHFFACGIDAAVWLFGLSDYRANKIEIINNAIDLQKYSYNASARLRLRCELNLKDYFVIGNIGRLTQQKNQSWLLVLLHQLRSQNLPIKLVLVGNGEDDAKLKEECKKLKLQDSVLFLGLRKDVPDLLSTFDLFLLPSKYEGLPVILVEAQASGITCCVSDSVTTEVNVTKNIKYISISQGITPWVTEIINVYNNKLSNIKLRKNALKIMKNGKFDIESQANSLYCKYLRLLGLDE